MNIYEIKKSKFVGMLFDIKNKDDVLRILNELRQEHKKANHFCYAFISENESQSGMSDDGEPKGTAGKPLFNLLMLKKQKGKLLVVIRYYGGKKLGASVLLRSYINAAKTELY